MKNCIKCQELGKVIRNDFDIIGKTFYKIDLDTIFCYRHWYQSDRPKYLKKGDYYSIVKESEKSKG